MRYKLQRNANGMITQCENADGGNIYAQREEINKKALENLQRATPGKLGNLANLQIFNFQIVSFASGSGTSFVAEYNRTSGFPANATQVVMFGVGGIDNKALYYNIKDVKVALTSNNAQFQNLLDDSYIEFYTLQNIETSTTSLGTKIPQPSTLYGNGGGALSFFTDGDVNGHQSFQTSFNSDAVNIPANSKGLRASGLALKTIYLNFGSSIDLSQLLINCLVYVDNTSVSRTF